MADDKDDLEKRRLKNLENLRQASQGVVNLNSIDSYEMNVDEQIRDTALGSAVHLFHRHFWVHEHRLEAVLDAAKRFEKYIREGE